MVYDPLPSIDALAVILSLDVARLIRHCRADRSVLWLQAATSAEQVLRQALAESAGRRDSDEILRAALRTILGFLGTSHAEGEVDAA